MMKYMLTATALVLILMVMWLPARTPPEIFEETALREALMLRTGEGIPMPETAANLAVEYLDGLVWVSPVGQAGAPDGLGGQGVPLRRQPAAVRFLHTHARLLNPA